MASLERTVERQEETWIQQAARGDLDAFNELVLLYQETAYNHAVMLLSDPDQAEDAVQESFIKAFHGISHFRKGNFRAWLLRIVTNNCYDMLRKAHRHPTQALYPEVEDGEEFESPAWIADPAPSIQAQVEQKEESIRLYRAMNQLPGAYRSVLALVEMYGMDYSEVAVVMDIPLGTVKSRLARARMQMREKLHSSSAGWLDPSIQEVDPCPMIQSL